MHRWQGTDNGSQCFRCGLVIDFAHPASECDGTCGNISHGWEHHDDAHSYAPPCPGPKLNRAHHFVYEGDGLNCAYGDARSTAQAFPKNGECIGG
jgi:hypothetical protein